MSSPFVWRRSVATLALVAAAPLGAQQWLHPDTVGRTNQSMFRVLDQWPAPNETRAANGKPGPKYWQQRVDYVIRVSLDTVTHTVTGSERVTYHNNSPDELGYLWFQLDQNIDNPDVSEAMIGAPALPKNISARWPRRFLNAHLDIHGGDEQDHRVQVAAYGGSGRPAGPERWRMREWTRCNGTQMKVEPSSPLRRPGARQDVEIDWTLHRCPSVRGADGRGAAREGEGRLALRAGPVVPARLGLRRRQRLGDRPVPGPGGVLPQLRQLRRRASPSRATTSCSATGVAHQPRAGRSPLHSEQRLTQGDGRARPPVFIVRRRRGHDTPASRPVGTGAARPGSFNAENVRDFAWVSSKTYVWDAMGFRYRPTDKPIELHSLYPRDAMPLWDSVSTKAIAQTIETYGRLAFEYPYPKAVNVHGPVFGMEYPMIAFCGARPTPDGKVSPELARALVWR
ncbi:MAG: hypothetical protein U5K74_16225 [Gemmatimonadaceae bacterium]|nr:hypothetical protein [Gemmatimonadaceae bacterium]